MHQMDSEPKRRSMLRSTTCQLQVVLLLTVPLLYYGLPWGVVREFGRPVVKALQWQVHGKWCGFGNEGDGSCNDHLDCGCKHHDQCYRDFGYFNCKCDTQLVRSLRDVTGFLPSLIRGYFSVSPCKGADLHGNDASCNVEWYSIRKQQVRKYACSHHLNETHVGNATEGHMEAEGEKARWWICFSTLGKVVKLLQTTYFGNFNYLIVCMRLLQCGNSRKANCAKL